MSRKRTKVSYENQPSLTSSLLQSADKIVGNSAINSVVEFAESYRGLDFRLYPAQKVIMKMMWGEPLSNDLNDNAIEWTDDFNEEVLFVFTEVEWLNHLYDNKFCNYNHDMYVQRVATGRRFGEVVLPIGRRGSKTVMIVGSAGYLLYNLYEKLDQDFFHYFNLIKSNPLCITFVSNNKGNSYKPYKMLKTFLEGSDFLSKYIYSANDDRIIMLSPTGYNMLQDGLYVTEEYQLIITHSTPSGRIRGDTNIFISLDEYCFLRDANSVKIKYLDEELYDATVPSTTTIVDPKTGQSWGIAAILSSVNGMNNHMHKLYKSSFDDPSTLMFHLRSFDVNRNIPPETLHSKHKKSPTGYKVEYLSHFNVMLSSWLADCWPDFEACISLGSKPKVCGANGLTYFAGIDFGFINDPTVVAIGHVQNGFTPGFVPKNSEAITVMNVDDVVVVLDALIVWKPEPGSVLSPRQVVQSIIQLLKMFNIRKAVYDQYSKVTIEELLDEAGLIRSGRFEVFNATAATNDMLATMTKEQILSHKLELLDHEDLISQFSGLVEIYKGGFVKVENSDPSVHDDIYSALSRLIYLCLTEGIRTLSSDKKHTVVPVSMSTGDNSHSVTSLGRSGGIYGARQGGARVSSSYGRRR